MMNKAILSLIFALATLTFCNAQRIEIKKSFGGYIYSQNGARMTMGDMVDAMESNAAALRLIKKARANNATASVIGFVGGGLIGWPIGTALAGGESNWNLAAYGAGLVVVTIAISTRSNRQAKKAVELYNASLETSSLYEFKPQFSFIANGNGLGFSMSF